MTLVVNLFAGPGAGKSTTAARVFADLKGKEVEVELAHEYAKDLTWEERHKAIKFQPYVAANQIWRVHRLLGQVDVVITDSPILFSAIYKGEGYTPAFERYLFDTFHHWDTLNFRLIRSISRKYSPKGRRQSFRESIELDDEIKHLLDRHHIKYVSTTGPPAPHEPIVRRILEEL